MGTSEQMLTRSAGAWRRRSWRLAAVAGGLTLAVGGLVCTVSVPADASVAPATLPTPPMNTFGGAVSWGPDNLGQLGDHGFATAPVPVGVSGLTDNVRQVAAGNGFTVAAMIDGSVVGWGTDRAGQIGPSPLGGSTSVPVPIPGLSDITQVSADVDVSYALDSTGAVWSWNRCRASDPPQWCQPVHLTGLPVITQISGDLFLASNGSVWFASGQPVAGLTGVRQVAKDLNDDSYFALMSDSTVQAWGANYAGQLGDGTMTGDPGDDLHFRRVPAPVLRRSDHTVLTGVTQIVGGDQHSLAIVGASHDVYAWGMGSQDLGSNCNENSCAQVGHAAMPTGLSGAVSVAAGRDVSMAVTADGSLWSWGVDWDQQLGRSAGNDDNGIPARVSGVSNALQVSIGYDHHVAAVFIPAVVVHPPSVGIKSDAGVAYSGFLTATGGTQPYLYSVSGLPPGLSSDVTGHITGASQSTGATSFTVTVNVRDARGRTATMGLLWRNFTVVPDVQGMTGAGASQTITNAGLVPSELHDSTICLDPGFVIAQHPGFAAEVAGGTPISYTVDTSPKKCTIK